MAEEQRSLMSNGTKMMEPNSVYADEDSKYFEGAQRCCGLLCGFFNTWICPCCCPTPYQRIPEGFVGVVQEFGRFSKLYRPGLYYVNPCTEDITMVDKREIVLPIRQQTVMTKDNLNVIIDAVVYYRVENTYRSLFSVKELEHSIIEIAHTSLRDVFGVVTLQEALEERDLLAEELVKLIAPAAANWGVNVRRVLMQDLIFTPDMQKTLSSAATSRRIAESKVISAQADVVAAKLMRTASDILNTPAAMQIRYLESINSVGKSPNPKVVFYPSNFKQIGTSGLLEMQKASKM